MRTIKFCHFPSAKTREHTDWQGKLILPLVEASKLLDQWITMLRPPPTWLLCQSLVSAQLAEATWRVTKINYFFMLKLFFLRMLWIIESPCVQRSKGRRVRCGIEMQGSQIEFRRFIVDVGSGVREAKCEWGFCAFHRFALDEGWRKAEIIESVIITLNSFLCC